MMLTRQLLDRKFVFLEDLNTTEYYYELNGELAQAETDGELVEYFYDVFGNLVEVETPNKLIEYKVDGFNRRVSKTIRGSDVTRYIWQDQLRLAAELNGDGTLRSQFIYTDGVNSPEYMIKDGVRYYFVKDHRGSVLKVVDVGTGEIKQELKYSEFGEVLQDTNPGFQSFGFAGGLYDHDTKLVRFGARDYDGKIGRWLVKDPVRFRGNDTNLYAYVSNDPVNFIDPKGLYPAWAIAYTIIRTTLTNIFSTVVGFCTASPSLCSFEKKEEVPEPEIPEPIKETCNSEYQSCENEEEKEEQEEKGEEKNLCGSF